MLPLATQGIISVDGTLIVDIVVFLVMLGILWRWVYPFIEKRATARQQEITKALDQAEQDRDDAEARLNEATKQLDEARQQASQVIAGAGRQADQIRQESRERATEDAQRIASAAAQDIEAERQRAIQSVRGDVADLVAQATERVIGGTLDDGRHRELIEQAIESVGSTSPIEQN